MDTISSENVDQISSLVDAVSSLSSNSWGVANTFDVLSIENSILWYVPSLYSRIALVLGLGLFVFLRILKEKVKANIRAKAFEKRAQKKEKKDLEKKPNQEDLIKNIFNKM